ncbi:MAG: DMT family transporter [Rhodobacteraceae bacterium]|nr:DMT family transporter [Paracoccaceae bacterium]
MRIGVVLIMTSMAITPMGDAFSKSLGATYSPFFICFLRYFLAGLLALLIAWILGRTIIVPRNDWGGMLFRTALVMGAMTCLIAALSMVPLATAVGGFLIAPIVATVLSVLYLKENLTGPRVVGSVTSFLGAVMIARPEAGFDPGGMLAVAGGVFLGSYLVATRGAASVSDPISSLAVQCLLGSGLLLPIALLAGPVPLSKELIGGGLGLGLVTAACHFLTVAAYAREEASILSPFLYFNMIAAVVVGFFLFQEIPSPNTLIGLFCIAFGGWCALISNDKLSSCLTAGKLAVSGLKTISQPIAVKVDASTR